MKKHLLSLALVLSLGHAFAEENCFDGGVSDAGISNIEIIQKKAQKEEFVCDFLDLRSGKHVLGGGQQTIEIDSEKNVAKLFVTPGYPGAEKLLSVVYYDAHVDYKDSRKKLYLTDADQASVKREDKNTVIFEQGAWQFKCKLQE